MLGATSSGRGGAGPSTRRRGVRLAAASAVVLVLLGLAGHVTALDPPLNVQATASGPTSVTVAWQAPALKPGEAVTGYKVTVFPSSGVVPLEAPFRPANYTQCLALPPIDSHFVWGRTSATACAEALSYGPCTADVPAGAATICNSWPTTLSPQTHSGFSQLFFDGATPRLRLDYRFGTNKTLAARFNDARLRGEATTWEVVTADGAGRSLRGTWRFSDSMGVFKTGTGTTRFSTDDGLWMAAPGAVNGNVALPTARPFFGQGNPNSGDITCNNLYVDSVAVPLTGALTSAIFFDESCSGVTCAPTLGSCSRGGATCCNGACLAEHRPDGSFCEGVGTCRAGACVPLGPVQDIAAAGGATSALFTGLSGAVTYNASVQAYGPAGLVSEYAVPVAITTPAGRPTAPPRAVSVRATLQPLDLFVTWRAPGALETGGAILGYRISVVRNASTDPLFGGQPGTPTVLDVGDVASAVVPVRFGALPYDVTVLAYTVAGDGPPSAVQTVEALGGVPDFAPTNVKVSVTGNSSLLVEWDVPQNRPANASITGVEVRAVSPNTDVTQVLTARPGLISVRGARTHSITLRFRSPVGVGPASPAVSITSPDGKPTEAPLQVTVTPLSATSVRVAWTPPSATEHNGRLLGYKVRYLPTFGIDPNPTQLSNPDYRNCLFLPTTNRFVWGRTTSTACAEQLTFTQPCTTGGVPAGTPGICPSWPPTLAALTHRRFSQVFFDGPEFKLRLDYNFQTAKTIEDRFRDAAASGEATDWKVYFEDGNATEVSGVWRYSDQLVWTGTPGGRLSPDDGLWMASPGTVDGDSGLPNRRPFYGHGNAGGSDALCPRLYIDSVSVPLKSTLSTALFFDNACGANQCRASVSGCRALTGDCCNGRCVEADKPDGALCNDIGRCQAGSCVAVGQLRDVALSTSVTITGLNVFEPYNFSVTAYTSAGDGPFSVAVEGRTTGGAPTGPPLAVAVGPGAGAQALAVAWQAPSELERRGLIAGYKVRYARSASTDVLFNNRSATPTVVDVGNATSTELTVPTGALPYDVTVAAYTVGGDGPESPPASGAASSGVPAARPVGVRATQVAGTRIVVNWAAPRNVPLNAVITGADVSAVSPDLTFNASLDASGAGSLDVRGGRAYVVSVRLRSAAGAGPAAAGITVQTADGAPTAAPSGITVTAINSTAVRVTFVAPPPAERNGAVTQYTVAALPVVGVVADPGFGGMPDYTPCLAVPATQRFVWGRTSASACAEGLGYGPCTADVPAAAATICNSWPTTLSPQTHTGFSQVFFDGATPKMRIDYRFNGSKTLADRFNDARLRGEPTSWQVVTDDGSAPTTLDGTWFFSDNMGPFKATGTGTTRFSNDDGLWMAAPGIVNGNRGNPAGPFYGQGNPNAGDTTCGTLWTAGRATQLSGIGGLTSALFFDASCEAVRCAPRATGCLRQTSDCCNGRCVSEVLPDNSVCDVVGSCQAGVCNQIGETATSTTTSVVLGNLLPFEPYNFSVSASTSGGAGPYSAAVAGRTTESAPSGPPQAVAVAATPVPRQLAVSWAEPLLAEQRGAITGYKVFLRRNASTDRLFGNAADPGVLLSFPATARNASVSVAFGALPFDVSVLASTQVGDGPLSAPVTREALGGVPAFAPASVVAQVTGSAAVQVDWTVPLQPADATITGVDVRAVSATSDETFTVPTKPALVTLRGGRTHTVTVRFRSAAGVGPASGPVTVRSPDGNPTEAPLQVAVAPINGNSVEVTFQPPRATELNGRLLGYKVTYVPTATISTAPTGPPQPPDYARCLGVPAANRFVWGRTSASACAEVLGYGPCTADAAAATICNSWPTTLSPQTHTGFSQVFFDGAAGRLRIDYRFNGSKTLADRFNDARVAGEPTTWTVWQDDGSAPTTLDGTWFFSDNMGPFKATGTAATRFSNDDGLWMAAPGIVNGNRGLPTARPYFGQANPNGGDVSCGTLYVNSAAAPLRGALTSALFFDDRCQGMTCGGPNAPAGSCLVQTADCCNGRCVEAIMPDNTFCDGIGSCQAGVCVPLGVVRDVGNVTAVTLTGLTSLAPYNVTVRAYTSAGDGPASVPVAFTTTNAAVPADPPRNVSASSSAAASLTVTWNVPLFVERGGTVSGYRVIVVRNASTNRLFGGQPGTPTTITAGPAETTATFAVAVGALPYDVTVEAFNTFGTGPRSAPAVTALARGGTPAVAPININVTAVGSGLLSVAWTVPQDRPIGATVLGVVVRATSPDSDVTQELAAPGTIAVRGGRRYGVSLSFRGEGGVGPASAIVFVMSTDSAPTAAPTAVALTVLNSTAIRVDFQPPPAAERNGVVTQYRINVLPTFGLLTEAPAAGRPDYTPCLALPANRRFVWGRTTARACAELLNYGDCRTDAPAGQSFICNSWPSTVAPQTHTAFSQIFFDGTTPKLRLDYRFAGAKTLAGRFNDARLGGEPTSWRVVTDDGSAPSVLNGTWFFSDSMGPFKAGSSAAGRFSNDDGAWMAAPGAVNGNRGLPTARPYYGQINPNGGDVSCATLYVNSQTVPLAGGLTSALFFDDTCSAVACNLAPSATGNECRVQTSECCNGRCVEAHVPDVGVVCGDVGTCQGGACVPFGRVETAGAAARSFVITGLTPFEPYNISVAADTRGGRGPSSAPLAAVTQQSAPTEAPAAVAARPGAQPLELLVSWAPPPRADRKGAILGYVVTARRSASTDALFGGRPDRTGVTVTVGNVTGVSLGVEYGALDYDITVAASNAVGAGPASAAVTAQGFDGTPLVAPSAARATAAGQRELLVEWRVPTGVLANATLAAVQVNVDSEVGNPLPSFSRVFRASPALVPVGAGQAHTVSLRFRSASGLLGPASPLVTVRTPDSSPTQAPLNVAAVSTSPTTVQVTFEPPPRVAQNGQILGYRVSVLPTFGLLPAPVGPPPVPDVRPCMAPTDTANGNGLVFGRTSATACAEALPYRADRQCTGDVPAGTAELCNTWASSLAPVTHDRFSQLFFDGATPKLRLDYRFAARKTLRQRLLDAASMGEPTNWTVWRLDGSAPTAVDGTWFFADKITAASLPATTNGFLSPDDGLWMAAPGVVDGDTGLPSAMPYSGHGNAQGSDASCGTLYIDSAAVALSGPLSTALFFDTACAGKACPSGQTECRVGTGQCCAGQCIETLLPDDTFCGAVGACQAGQCVQRGAFVNAGNVTSVQIPGLSAFEDYNISVVAFTSAGDGPPSVPVAVRTREGIPTAAPANFTVAAAPGTLAVQASWAPPPLREQRGVLLGYKVQVRRSAKSDALFNGQSDLGKLVDVGAVTSAPIRVDFGALEYEFRVLAYTAAGDGTSSGIVTAVSGDGVPLAAPGAVEARAQTATAVRVTWADLSRLDKNSAAVTYNVTYTLDGAAQPAIATAGTALTLTAPMAYTAFVVRVRAVSPAGAGPASVAASARSLEGTPLEAPASVTPAPAGPRSLALTLAPPPAASVRGVLSRYEVRVTLDRDSNGAASGVTTLSEFNATSATAPTVVTVAVQPFSTYTFVVFAGTRVGFGTQSAMATATTPQALPSAPMNVDASADSDTSIVVLWDAPNPANGVVAGYQISYLAAGPGGAAVSGAVNVTAPATQHRVTGLRAFTSYEVRVAAFNRPAAPGDVAGLGPNSLPDEVVTNEGLPDAVRALAVATQGADALGVTFMPPANPRGVIVRYDVEYRVASSAAGFATVAVFNGTAVVLEGLRPFTTYEVRVRAATSAGVGVPTSATGTTAEDIPTAAPVLLPVQATSATSITVLWMPLPPASSVGTIVRYTVRVELSPEEVPFVSPAQNINRTLGVTTGTMTVIGGLAPYRRYLVRVAAATQPGEGPFSAPGRVRTLETAVGGPPQSVAAVAMSPSEVLVSWAPPATPDLNGVITQYHVEVKRTAAADAFLGIGSDLGVTRAVLGTSTTIPGLRAAIEHTATVYAENAVGRGPASAPVPFTTLTAAPTGIVQSFAAGTAQATSLTVQWQPVQPADRNGAITAYTLSWDSAYGGGAATVSDPAATSYTATGLEEFVEYTFTIRARNAAGTGPAVNATGRTLPDAPGSAPTALRGEPTATTSLVVMWEEPLAVDVNGPSVDGYLVRWRRVCRTAGPVCSRDGPDCDGSTTTEMSATAQLTLSDREEFSEYAVSVAAVGAGAVGPGPFSTEVMVRTLPARPTAAPAGLTVASTARGIQANWSCVPPNDRNSEIFDYSIEIVAKTNASDALSLKTSDLSFTTPGASLRPNTVYLFKLLAESSKGNSPEAVAEIRTAEAPPEGSPGNIEVTSKSFTSLLVEWDPVPEDRQNGEVRGYRLQYEVTGGRRHRRAPTEIDVGLVTSYLLTGLTKGATYAISVSAYTAAGAGPFSSSQVAAASKAVCPPTQDNDDEGACVARSTSKDSGFPLLYIIIIVAAAIVLIVLIVVVLLCCRRNKTQGGSDLTYAAGIQNRSFRGDNSWMTKKEASIDVDNPMYSGPDGYLDVAPEGPGGVVPDGLYDDVPGAQDPSFNEADFAPSQEGFYDNAFEDQVRDAEA